MFNGVLGNFGLSVNTVNRKLVSECNLQTQNHSSVTIHSYFKGL